jgi:putative FmdB family regulatory protein
MPLYDYKCIPCNRVFEVKKSVNDPDPRECPTCKCGPVERYHGSDTTGLVQYKGTGWFKTDGKY